MRPPITAAGLCTLALATALAAPAQAAPGDPKVLVEGLAGPLTLALGPGSSATYVTQGFAGILSVLDSRGDLQTVTQNDNPAGEVTGVSVGTNAIYHIEADYSGPTSHVIRTAMDGSRTTVSDDLWAYEIANNPDGGQSYGFTDLDQVCAGVLEDWEEANVALELPPLSGYEGIIDSHAYQTTWDRGTIYVADAAANAILAVDEATGAISTVAVLPAPDPAEFSAAMAAGLEEQLSEQAGEPVDIPDCLTGQLFTPEPVPTDVEVGKGGMLHVSTLGGWMGEMLPLSSVYRIDPATGGTTLVASGMSGATGLAVAPSGDIYVAQMFGGEVSVIRVGSDTSVTLFAADSPGDVEVRGTTVFATTGVFGNGAIVSYTAPRGR